MYLSMTRTEAAERASLVLAVTEKVSRRAGAQSTFTLGKQEVQGAAPLLGRWRATALDGRTPTRFGKICVKGPESSRPWRGPRTRRCRRCAGTAAAHMPAIPLIEQPSEHPNSPDYYLPEGVKGVAVAYRPGGTPRIWPISPGGFVCTSSYLKSDLVGVYPTEGEAIEVFLDVLEKSGK